jgi:hypothetical protein
MAGKHVVKVRVLSGMKDVHALAMLFDAEVSVKTVLARALATHGCERLRLHDYDVVCFSLDVAAAEGERGFHLDGEDLDDVTVQQLHDSVGLNLVIQEHRTITARDANGIELCVAEAVVAEALLIGEQQTAVEAAARHAAEARACRLERDLQSVKDVLSAETAARHAAETRAFQLESDLETAKDVLQSTQAQLEDATELGAALRELAAREQASRQVLEQLLAAEAAVVDATEQRPARCRRLRES